MPMIIPSLAVLRLGLKSLLLHKLRSALATCGIVLGVASVIVMLAVGEAARFEAVERIKQLGATTIILRSVKPEKETGESIENEGTLSYGLTGPDLERIVSTVPSVLTATPMREFRKRLRCLDRKMEGRVVAVMPGYLAANGLKLARGRFITDLDNDRFANLAVLGAETAELLFPFDDPLGRTIRIDETQYYRVVGVTQRRAPSAGIGSSLAAQDFNRDVYLPFAADRARFGKVLTTERAGSFQQERLEISQITIAVDDVRNVRETAAIIGGLIKQFHKREDVAVTVPLDLLEKVEETQRIFSYVLGSIASIALVVGGIGIMNIMLATVSERTREIGIRRALGAKRSDIVRQFLAETVALSSLGGILGVCLGLAVAVGVTRFVALQTILRPWSPIVAFAISIAVGVVFGTYPATRAARMDPIEALRHE
jgi:putative ABC transport system permease protein